MVYTPCLLCAVLVTPTNSIIGIREEKKKRKNKSKNDKKYIMVSLWRKILKRN